MLTPTIILLAVAAVLFAANIRNIVRDLWRESVRRAWARRRRINHRRRLRLLSQQRARIAATRVLWPATSDEVDGEHERIFANRDGATLRP